MKAGLHPGRQVSACHAELCRREGRPKPPAIVAETLTSTTELLGRTEPARVERAQVDLRSFKVPTGRLVRAEYPTRDRGTGDPTVGRLPPGSRPEWGGRLKPQVSTDEMYATLAHRDDRVAVHLRAARTFTPRALTVLTALLDDLQQGLEQDLTKWRTDATRLQS